MSTDVIERINRIYDDAMFRKDPFGLDIIGFFNFGYWKGVEQRLELAQINLIETLVQFLSNRGTVLDIACGKGASTKFLTKYFDPELVVGTNISEKQLEACRIVAPECSFIAMDAAALTFDDSSVDNVLCVEAAFHFQTRRDFLEHAHRVLKPGGRLAMSDLLHDRHLLEKWGSAFPPENFVASVDELRAIVQGAGFRYVRAENTTEFCVKALEAFLIKRFETSGNLEMMPTIEMFQHYIASCNIYAIK